MKVRDFHLSGKKGFTLVEIVVVVLIIGMLATLAIPAFIGARTRSQAKTCSAQLRQIKYAKEAWAMDTKQAAGAIAAWNDLYPVYLKDMPECPTDGDYTIAAVSQDPTCSVGGAHVVP